MKTELRILLCMTLLATGCAPDSPWLRHEIVLAEKPGSAAFAEGVNLRRAGKEREAAAKFEEAARTMQDPNRRAEALLEMADIAGKAGDAPRQAELLKQAAELGDARASYSMARLHAHPVNPETVRLLSEMAQQRADTNAMLALARIYHDGMAGAPDSAQAEAWYRRAIETGSISATAELGRIWAQPDSGKTPAQAMELFSQAAKYDQQAVARDIAELYERAGKTREAVVWYELAAKNPAESVSVYNRLAQAYRLGEGVEKNDATALAWSIKAANAGSINATERVMRAYFNGEGTEASAEEGARWMERLLSLKPERAYGLAKDFAQGDGLPRSASTAFALAERAAGAGDTRAMRYLARAYEKGDGVAANTQQAAQWYAKAGIKRPVRQPRQHTATMRHQPSPFIAKAQQMEAEGKLPEALALYEQAARAGDTEAMLRAGSAYASGLGTAQDMDMAARWYAQSAQAGNAEGQYRLGLAYADGLGVNKDVTQARHWLEKASASGYPAAKLTLNTLLTAQH